MRIRLKFRLDDQVVYGCFSSVHRIGSANSSAVLYTPQELTEEEKTQARKNIGAQDPNLLVVTVDANVKASHTASEINTFVQGGGSAVLVWFSNVFHAKIITPSKCQFGTMFNAPTGATEWIMDVDQYGVAVFSDVICSALPSPNPIIFRGAVNETYDGSEEVIVEIPEGGGGNSVHFGEEEPTDAKTGDFWYDESEGEGGGGGLSDAECLALLVETDMLPAVYNADGKILTDENGKIILRY